MISLKKATSVFDMLSTKRYFHFFTNFYSNIRFQVKTANRAMTSRPNCFELYCAPLAPDQKRNPTHFEGIVSSYDPNRFQRYIFSADNVEQKKEWCKALKSTLDKLRVWHKDLPAPVPDSLGR